MSAAGPQFLVAPAPGRGWVVTCDRSSAVATFLTRRDAVQYAHACAQALRPSVVRVDAGDGAGKEAWVYGAYKGVRRTEPGQVDPERHGYDNGTCGAPA